MESTFSLSSDDERRSILSVGLGYEPSSREFLLVGSSTLPIGLSQIVSNPDILIDEINTFKHAVTLESISMGIATDCDDIVGTPRLRGLFQQHDTEGTTKDLLDETRRAMIDAHNFLSDGDEEREQDHGYDSYMGFSANLLRPGHPVLTTLGNCACIGVTPDLVLFEEQDWASGYVSFTAHNVFSSLQWTTLYAGLGYLSSQAHKLS